MRLINRTRRAFRLSDNFITKLKKDNELQYLQNIEKSKE